MSLYVLDTDVLTLFQSGEANVCQRVLEHPLDELATTVTTVEEQLSGWYTLLRRVKKRTDLARAYRRLAETVECHAQFHILRFTESAIERYEQLRGLKLGVRRMDLRIAAIALEHEGTLVTRNVRDFQDIPSLEVVNWAEEP